MSDSIPTAAVKSKGRRLAVHTQPQGHSAGTILTNRSRNMTVITPLEQRKSVTAPSLRRGTRWMHRSTLTMESERNPSQPDYHSSTHRVYNGSKHLGGAQRPIPCRTLHTSHFDIGMNKQLYHDTHYKMQFPLHRYDHPNKLHYQSITNWTHNVEGTDMQGVLCRPGHEPNYWSSYAVVHNKLGLQRGEGVPSVPQTRPTYEILTGQETGVSADRDHHRVSGNRPLNSVRLDPEQSLILQ